MNARRENGKIIIEIKESALVDNGDMHPETPYRVTDREKFLNHVVDKVCDIGDSGDHGSCPDLTKLMDACAEDAVMQGAGAELIEDEDA